MYHADFLLALSDYASQSQSTMCKQHKVHGVIDANANETDSAVLAYFASQMFRHQQIRRTEWSVGFNLQQVDQGCQPMKTCW